MKLQYVPKHLSGWSKNIFSNIGLKDISFTFDQELFTKLDQNADGLVSQEEFVAIIKKDKSLLDVLHGKQMWTI